MTKLTQAIKMTVASPSSSLPDVEPFFGNSRTPIVDSVSFLVDLGTGTPLLLGNHLPPTRSSFMCLDCQSSQLVRDGACSTRVHYILYKKSGSIVLTTARKLVMDIPPAADTEDALFVYSWCHSPPWHLEPDRAKLTRCCLTYAVTAYTSTARYYSSHCSNHR